MTLLFIRHGETALNAARVLQPAATPLSARAGSTGRRPAAGTHEGVATLGGRGLSQPAPHPPGLRDPGAPRPDLREFLCGGTRRVPAVPLPGLDPRPAWLRPADTGLRATWLGHSTVLIEIDGLRVLTDPVWGRARRRRGWPGPSASSRCRWRCARCRRSTWCCCRTTTTTTWTTRPSATLARLGVPFVTSLGVGAHLQAFGVDPGRITELDWWDSHRLPGSELEVTAAPSQHFSGRGLKDRNATLWSSLVLRTPGTACSSAATPGSPRSTRSSASAWARSTW
jgi:hypothetical protein